MKKNYKFGFSYIELVFAMVIVVILLAISAPFLTRKNFANLGSSYGEYRCWAVFKCEEGEYKDSCWHLMEQSRYNSNEFDYPEGHRVEQCKFLKPVGVDEYEVTLVSGGGGGSMAEFPTGVLKDKKIYSLFDSKDEEIGEYKSGNDTYKLYSRSYSIKATPGSGGESGNVITFRTYLNSFDEDGEIKINLCETLYNNTSISNYDNLKLKRNGQCVGKGGDPGRFVNDVGISRADYFKLLEVYDDKFYDEYGDKIQNYFGTGLGDIKKWSDENPILKDCKRKNGESCYLTTKSSIDQYKAVLEDLYIPNPKYEGTNTASIGDYTHFVTGVNTTENQYCKGGNCIVPGGKYGETKFENTALQRLKIKDDCEYDKDKGYYCFESDFGYQTEGKYNSAIAEKGCSGVQIVTLDGDDRHISDKVGSWDSNETKPSSIISNLYNDNVTKTLKEYYTPCTGFGVGGGGGGFTFFTETEPTCTYAKLGNVDIYDSDGYSALDEDLKGKITCKSSSENYFSGKKIFLKRSDGRYGNGGAIIIKW